MTIRRGVLLAVVAAAVLVPPAADSCLTASPHAARSPSRAAQTGGSDLDAFMRQVLARRDENWRKLQQYVLEEQETADLLGPGGERLFGTRREYAWYIRDGVFVRSPLRIDGVAVSEADRRTYETRWMERERERERARERRHGEASGSPVADAPDDAGRATQDGRDALLHLAQEPRFVSGAYFLRFEFEAGHYALVGREDYDGQDVLRIEYYPARLFRGDRDGDSDEGAPDERARLTRQMNKVARVTLWVEPGDHQIVKYTFENTDLDFLPGRSLVRLDDLRATMTMGQPFPGVWLPRDVDAQGAITVAAGTYAVRYAIRYADYREAEVKVRVR